MTQVGCRAPKLRTVHDTCLFGVCSSRIRRSRKVCWRCCKHPQTLHQRRRPACRLSVCRPSPLDPSPMRGLKLYVGSPARRAPLMSWAASGAAAAASLSTPCAATPASPPRCIDEYIHKKRPAAWAAISMWSDRTAATGQLLLLAVAFDKMSQGAVSCCEQAGRGGDTRQARMRETNRASQQRWRARHKVCCSALCGNLNRKCGVIALRG